MEIHPAPLVAKFSDLLLQMSRLESLRPHYDIDIVDWSRTPNKTISALEALQARTSCRLTFDLMLDHPAAVVAELVKDPRVDTIVLNLSSKDELDRLIDQIHMHKIRAGISVNPDNHFYQIVPYLPEVEMIQIFTIMPGMQGQPFLPQRLELVPTLRQFGFKGLIGIDGGVNREHMQYIKQYQVDILSVGSAIVKTDDPAKAYQEMCALL